MSQLQYTKGEYNRLGDRIRQSPDSISTDDLTMLQTLRLSYKNLLSAVFNILVEESKKIDKRVAIPTYRVKRIESIVSKLQREPKMQLSRMSDIAGCRCILQSNDKVYALKKRLEERLCVKHINDYISAPKSNGYKSLHLIVSLSENDSKTIEIQLRCLQDHNWATLVEITDLVYGTRIKELGSDGELAEFHRLLSYAYDPTLSIEQKVRIVNIANAHSYFKRISEIFSKNYIEVRNKWNASKQSKNNFYLISTDSSGSPEIASFKTFESAEKAYFETYLDNPGNRNIVLTHIKDASFDSISLAYSNYFLTYNALLVRCYQMMSDIVVLYYHAGKLVKFTNLYNQFLELTTHILGVHLADYVEFQNKVFTVKSINKRAEWANSIRGHLNSIIGVLQITYHKTPFRWKCLACSIVKSLLHRNFVRQQISPYKTENKK